MFIIAVITFACSLVSASLSTLVQEEIVKLSLVGVSIVLGLLTLIIAPWEIKVIAMFLPFIMNRLAIFQTNTGKGY